MGRDDEVVRLRARVAELQRERDHLVAIVDILQEISASLHFVDILQAIARKLGDAFGSTAARSSSPANRTKSASSRATKIRRSAISSSTSIAIPSCKRAFDSGETVFIPDAANDPSLEGIKARSTRATSARSSSCRFSGRATIIGAIFLRTDRDAEPFSDADVRFCQVVASLTAKALRNAHRFEALLRDQKDAHGDQRRTDLQRIALIVVRPPPARSLREERRSHLGRDAAAQSVRRRARAAGERRDASDR